MLECPNFIEVDGKQILMFSPQGLAADPKNNRYENIHNTGYVIGQFDEKSARFNVITDFKEVDHGFEFYAPQTMVAPDGRRIMWGWAGMMTPEREAAVPTIQNRKWVHVLSLPRELHVNDKLQLVQQPITEIIDTAVLTSFDNVSIGQYRIPTTADWTIKFSDRAMLSRHHNELVFERQQWESDQVETRQLTGDLNNLLLIVDVDVIEVYTDDGLNAMTARWF